MKRKGRLGALGAFLTALGLLEWTPTVGAQIPENVANLSDLAVFTGAATITTGDLCGVAVCHVGGGGTFNFASGPPIGCTVASDVEVDAPDVPPTGSCSITVTGARFSSVTCGTGVANGTATVTGTAGADAGETTTVNFVLVTFSSIGVIIGDGSESDGGDILDVGAVQLTATGVAAPNLFAPGNGPCATGFNVAGLDIIFDS